MLAGGLLGGSKLLIKGSRECAGRRKCPVLKGCTQAFWRKCHINHQLKPNKKIYVPFRLH